MLRRSFLGVAAAAVAGLLCRKLPADVKQSEEAVLIFPPTSSQKPELSYRHDLDMEKSYDSDSHQVLYRCHGETASLTLINVEHKRLGYFSLVTWTYDSRRDVNGYGCLHGFIQQIAGKLRQEYQLTPEIEEALGTLEQLECYHKTQAEFSLFVNYNKALCEANVLPFRLAVPSSRCR